MLGSTYGLWDPYSHTGHIKVAVVNEDKGDKVRGKKINVGNTLEDNLKKNDKFDWQFVSRKRQTMKLKWVNIMLAYTYLRILASNYWHIKKETTKSRYRI